MVSLFSASPDAAEKTGFPKRQINTAERYGPSGGTTSVRAFSPRVDGSTHIGRADSIPENEITRTLSLVTEALRLYPDTIVKKHLRAIHLCGASLFTVSISGRRAPTIVSICAMPEPLTDTPTGIYCAHSIMSSPISFTLARVPRGGMECVQPRDSPIPEATTVESKRSGEERIHSPGTTGSTGWDSSPSTQHPPPRKTSVFTRK